MTMRQDDCGTDEQHATMELPATTCWPGGKVSFSCVGVDCNSETAQAVTEALAQLANEWNLMVI